MAELQKWSFKQQQQQQQQQRYSASTKKHQTPFLSFDIFIFITFNEKEKNNQHSPPCETSQSS